MIRDILFRGKSVDNDEWVYGYYATRSNHACFEHELEYTSFILKDEFMDWGLGELAEYEVIPETVGQFTGLTDKNGKKIFEGDIVEFTNKFTHQKGHAEIVFEAFKWKYSGCYYGGNPIVWLCIDDNSIEYEVIGNIYDNPELLEEV